MDKSNEQFISLSFHYCILPYLLTKFGRTKSKFILIWIFVFLLNCMKYYYFRNQNFFEQMNINRIFNYEILKTRYNILQTDLKSQFDNTPEWMNKQQIQKIAENYKLIYQVFTNKNQLTIYDKYKLIVGYNTPYQSETGLLYGKLLEHLMFYLQLMIFSSIQTITEKSKAGRKWLIAILLCGYSMEVNYLLQERTDTDFIDYFFPQYSIFDRINLIRSLAIPFILFIDLFFKFFYKTELMSIQEQVAENLNSIYNIFSKQSFNLNSGKNYCQHLESINKNLIDCYKMIERSHLIEQGKQQINEDKQNQDLQTNENQNKITNESSDSTMEEIQKNKVKKENSFLDSNQLQNMVKNIFLLYVMTNVIGSLNK